MSQLDQKESIHNQTNPSQRLCDNCHGEVGMKDHMCTRCGFALSPVRSTKTKWRGISFPVFVFWVSVFCVLMMLWLPR